MNQPGNSSFKPHTVEPTSSHPNLSRITIVAAAVALVVALIGWFATGGFGTQHAQPNATSGTTSVASSAASSASASSQAALTIDAQVDQKLGSMTLEQKVAQMFIVTPEALTGADLVTAAGDLTRIAIDDRPVGGVIYMAPNLEDAEQTTEMLKNTQEYAKNAIDLPMFLCVDEEGGEVTRVGGRPGFDAENLGDMADIGASDDTEKAREAGRTMGEYLTKLGFNVDFAPVADIANNPLSDVMASRSFGDTADEVAPMVAAQVEGFSEAGILCCAKHFPGIGAALGDSHYSAITTEKTIGEMQTEEFIPFSEAIKAGVPMIMVGHLACPQVTGDSTPASLSRNIVTDTLRNQLGFKGIIVTDSLAMGAITDSYDQAEVGVLAIEAGVDIVLMPESFEAAYRGVLNAIDEGRITTERIDESVRRIIQTKLTMKGA